MTDTERLARKCLREEGGQHSVAIANLEARAQDLGGTPLTAPDAMERRTCAVQLCKAAKLIADWHAQGIAPPPEADE